MNIRGIFGFVVKQHAVYGPRAFETQFRYNPFFIGLAEITKIVFASRVTGNAWIELWTELVS